MSLEQCPTCKRQISTVAVQCPKCGHPLDEGWAEEVKAKRDAATGTGALVLFVLVGAITLWTWLGGSDEKLKFTEDDYGDQWGFTVSELEVSCWTHDYGAAAGSYRYRPHVIITASGKDYGLNGAAMGVYPSAHEIMKRDKYDAFGFRGPHDILRKGLSLCE